MPLHCLHELAVPDMAERLCHYKPRPFSRPFRYRQQPSNLSFNLDQRRQRFQMGTQALGNFSRCVIFKRVAVWFSWRSVFSFFVAPAFLTDSSIAILSSR